MLDIGLPTDRKRQDYGMKRIDVDEPRHAVLMSRRKLMKTSPPAKRCAMSKESSLN